MQAVINYLEQNQSRFVSELCDYVRFPSVSAQPEHRNDLQACAEWVLNHCQQIGLEARLCPTQGHPIIVAKTRGVNADPSPRPSPLQKGTGRIAGSPLVNGGLWE